MNPQMIKERYNMSWHDATIIAVGYLRLREGRWRGALLFMHDLEIMALYYNTLRSDPRREERFITRTIKKVLAAAKKGDVV